ncbi:hypothetical protein LINGRAHAP2_LOCUS13448 [Linum grandiflorum]
MLQISLQDSTILWISVVMKSFFPLPILADGFCLILLEAGSSKLLRASRSCSPVC